MASKSMMARLSALALSVGLCVCGFGLAATAWAQDAKSKPAPAAPSDAGAKKPDAGKGEAKDKNAKTYRLVAQGRLGATSLVTRTLKADGTIQPEPAGPSSGKSDDPKAKKEPAKLQMKVEGRLEYHERVSAENADGSAGRVVRRVRKALAQIGGELRPSNTTIRPSAATIVASQADRGVFVYSQGGPLLRQELDLVRGPGDPLGWIDLFPTKEVAVGETWDVGEATAREISDYDALASNTLKATLEKVEGDLAQIRFRGIIHGVARGGEGKVSCSAVLLLDVKKNRLRKFLLNRNENRAVGPVEPMFDIRSSLTLDVQDCEVPGDLKDGAIADVGARPSRDQQMLLYRSPSNRFEIRHDRDWHLFWDDAKLTVFKRLDQGELISQCNIVAGAQTSPGNHQDIQQFEGDVKKALGARFVRIIGKGELTPPQRDAYLYKMAVEGKEGMLGILWNYYLAASPQGEQLLLTFTVSKAQEKAFGEQDVQLVKKLEWLIQEAPPTSVPVSPKSAAERVANQPSAPKGS